MGGLGKGAGEGFYKELGVWKKVVIEKEGIVWDGSVDGNSGE